MSNTVEISAELFEKPSGTVLGFVTATMLIKGKHKRFAHATLLVGESPQITIEAPKSLPLDQVDILADNLKAFADKVRSLI